MFYSTTSMRRGGMASLTAVITRGTLECQTLTCDPTDLAAAIHARAVALRDDGKPARARQACLRSLRLFVRHCGRRHPDVANVVLELALAEHDLGRHAQSLRLVERALRILKFLRGVGQLRVQALGQLGSLHLAQGDYRLAEASYRRALVIASSSPDPGAAITAMNGLGVVCKYTARFAEAARYYRKALALTQHVRGAHHPLVATILHNMGGLEHSRGRFARGEPFARRAVALRERALGPDHPDVAADLAALAAIVMSRGNRGEAELLYRRAIRVFGRALGRGHWEVGFNLGQLAALCQAEGRLADASRLYGRAVRTLSRQLGPRHPLLAMTLWNLASLRRGQHRPSEAARLCRTALAIFRATIGSRHPDTIACAADLSLSR